ncbi:hypothetical protein ABD76_10115 [Paenibacillus dendritiformis]|uniref:ABC transporter ATP-binding protein n=1 Tax=Paenibacillus dendritiformis TaxID=130049 RepID=UPI0018CFB86E|nr:ATP-binding cassette domain-containing protein [Paenibacillus dendritiformis]MBG9792822.1 hypothetical protein [Paenibacillus dendritiformis]
MEINIQNLTHNYITYRKRQGLKGAFQDFIFRKYEHKTVIKSVDLSIQAGELIGLLGPNGAGKTTLMKIMSGLIHPTSGTVEVMGHVPFKKTPDFLRKLGVVLGQKSQLTWDLPPIDTLQVLKEIYKVDDVTFQKRLDELVHKLNVEHCIQVPVRKLSLGERMKFEIIASLLHSPKLLLLDEPTIGLDMASQKSIRSFIKEINREYGTTVILTSHYAKDIEEIAERLVILNQGSIHYDGLLRHLQEENHHEMTLKIQIKEHESLAHWGLKKTGDRQWETHLASENLNTLLSKLTQLYTVTHIQTYDIPFEEKLYTLFTRLLSDGEENENLLDNSKK